MNDFPTESDGKPLHNLGDYRCWGNDYSILKVEEQGLKLRLMVFRDARMEVGDYLAIPHNTAEYPQGSWTRYEIKDIRTPGDPGDQHFITAVHAPMGKTLLDRVRHLLRLVLTSRHTRRRTEPKESSQRSTKQSKCQETAKTEWWQFYSQVQRQVPFLN